MIRHLLPRGGALRALAAVSFCAALAAPLRAQPLQLTLDAELYEGGEAGLLTISGAPGACFFLFLSTTPGPTTFGFGTLDVGFDGVHVMTKLLIPANGDCGAEIVFDCESLLLRQPLFLQAVEWDPIGRRVLGISNPIVLQGTGGDCGLCVRHADADDVALFSGGHALWLPGIGTDFVFAPGGQFIERADGTARLVGLARRASAPDERFLVDVLLSGRVNPGDADFPPAGSPKQELEPPTYHDMGGPIDPRLWHYYLTVHGTLLGDGALEGAAVHVDGTGPAFQVGYGANGKNTAFGASGWLTYQVLTQPDSGLQLPEDGGGDFNLDLGGDCIECARQATSHALWLPGISKKLVFAPGEGEFVEYANGTASLSGRVHDVDDPDLSFDVVVSFGGRINPGSPDYPPAGSPKKELGASHYAENGGLVDPSTWHYYEETLGVVLGVGDYAGAELHISRAGPAFQVGFGASGKDEEYGASGWLEVELVSQPDDGPTLDEPDKGDINIDVDCP